MRQALILAAAILVATGSVLAQEPAQVSAPKLPDSVVALIEVPKLSALEQNVRAYVTSVRPGTQVPPLPMALMSVTKLANPAALDGTLPQRMLFVGVAGGNPVQVAVLCATDAQVYMNSLNPALTKTRKEGGISLFTEGKQYFDRAAFLAAPEEERGDFQQFMKTRQIPVAIGVSGRFVCVSENKDAVAAALAMVKGGALTEEPLLGGGDLAAYVPVRKLMDSLSGGTVGNPFNILRSQVFAMPYPPPQQEQMHAIFNAYIDTLEGLTNQVDRFLVRLSADQERLALGFTMDAAPTSKLAAYLASVPAGRPDMLKYLPEDAFLITAAKLGNLDALTEWAVALQKSILAGQGLEGARLAELEQTVRDLAAAFGGEYAFAMRSGEGFRMIQATRMKSVEDGKILHERMPFLAEIMTEIYGNMGLGMKMEFNPAMLTHNGAEIAEWRYLLDQEIPDDADPLLAHQRQTMAAMFGEALTCHSTFAGQDWVMAMGEDSLDSLKAVLDGTQAKLSEQAAFQQMLTTIPPESDGVIYVRLTDYMKWTFSFMDAAARGAMPPRFANIEFERGPGIITGINTTGSRVSCDLVIPSVEIKNLIDGFTEVMKAGPMGRARED